MSRSGRSGPPYRSYEPDRESLWNVLVPDWLQGLIDERTRRRLLVVVGLGSLGMAILLVLAPWLPVWLVGPFLPLLLLAEAGRGGVIAVGLAGALVGLWSLYAKTGGDETTSEGVELPPTLGDRRRNHDQGQGTGERLNTLIERVSGDADDPSTGVNRTVDKRQVRKELRDVAVDVLADHHGVPVEEARHAVDEGTWTESRRAAALLGDDDAPRPRLGTRIRDWASGDPFERRVYAAVDEITRTTRLQVRSDLLAVPIDPVEPGDPTRGSAADPREVDDRDAPDLGLDRPGGAGPTVEVPDPEPDGPRTIREDAGDDPAADDGDTDGDPSDGDGSDGAAGDREAPAPDDDADAGGDLPEGWVTPGGDDESGDADVEETARGESR